MVIGIFCLIIGFSFLYLLLTNKFLFKNIYKDNSPTTFVRKMNLIILLIIIMIMGIVMILKSIEY